MDTTTIKELFSTVKNGKILYSILYDGWNIQNNSHRLGVSDGQLQIRCKQNIKLIFITRSAGFAQMARVYIIITSSCCECLDKKNSAGCSMSAPILGSRQY